MDDERTAVNIGVTLSTQLISASLSMMAIIGALIVFVIDKRQTNIAFFILFGLGFLFFFMSILKGGKGIDIVRKQGFVKKWNLECSKSLFNSQALFNIIGIMLCLKSFVFTKPKIDEQSIELKKLNCNIERILDSKQRDKNEMDILKQEIIELRQKIEFIKKSNEIKK